MKNRQTFVARFQVILARYTISSLPRNAVFTLRRTEVSQRGGLTKMAAAKFLWLQSETIGCSIQSFFEISDRKL